MRTPNRNLVCTLACVAAAFALGACSGLPGFSEVNLPSRSTFVPTNSNAFNQAAVNTNRPVSAADLVDGQGACVSGAGTVASDGDPGQPGARGIGLDMTECQVVQALGAPQATEIAANERGERAVTMTFLSGDRAGVYRFVRGRLVTIERAPGSGAPERPAKPPAKPAKKPQPA